MVQYFLRNDRIQKLFVENVTTLIKMWSFLERVSSPSAVKKGEAEAGTLYAWRCDVLQKTFRCLNGKKGDAGAATLYGGKRKRAVRLAFMTNWPTVATCKT